MEIANIKSVLCRLLQRTKIESKGSCWEWQGAHTDYGHGVISVGGRRGRMERVHRVSYTIFKGNIPDGAVIRHTCDNPACINPRHLIPGSYYENNHDCLDRGRFRSGFAKLDPDTVFYIRERSALGEPSSSISNNLNVALSTIRDIVARRTWKNLEGNPVEYEKLEF